MIPPHPYLGTEAGACNAMYGPRFCGFPEEAFVHQRDEPIPFVLADQVDPAESVLQEAERIINGQRQATYGSALESFTQIGQLWSTVLGVKVSAEKVAICLIQLKVSRALNNLEQAGELHRDSIVDIAGYTGCLEKIAAERQ